MTPSVSSPMHPFLRPLWFRHHHPFRLLLYLEWILLGIALLAVGSPRLLGPPHYHRPPPPAIIFSAPDHGPFFLGTLVSILALGGLGLWMPKQSRPLQVGYTGLGLGLSWLAVLWGGHGLNSFPPLLLIVVIRACLTFPGTGRLLVAGLAYGSFLLMLAMAFFGLRPFGVFLDRPLLPALRRLPVESLQSVLLGSMLNAALLFGLVLGFVLLLVSAVLSEYQSRQQLTAANQQLRQYALLIENQATLQERNRIAREIHDSVGHSLAAQSIQLENVAMFLPTTAGLAVKHLQQARQLGKEALQHVRQSVATLRLDPLQGISLEGAIANLITDFQSHHSLQIKAQCHLKVQPTSEVATALYRITQEALTNMAKHSHASQGRLRLSEEKTGLTLLIEDNGTGFDPSQNTTGFGLQSMQERAQALSGHFYLNSQPGQGCQIQVVIPSGSISR